MAGRVIAFPGVILTERDRGGSEAHDDTPVTAAPCPICTYPIRSDEFDVAECARCGRTYHHPCFWRVLPLADWLAYWKWLCETDAQDREDLCAACRQLEELGKDLGKEGGR